MRGGLDDTLARLARREELRRRGDAEETERAATDGPEAGPAAVGPAAVGPAGGGPAGGGPAGAGRPVGGRPNAGPQSGGRAAPHRGAPAGGHGAERDPVAEVAEAVRRVVAEHPGVTVQLRVEYDGRTYPLRVGPAEPGAVARPAPPGPPPAWPAPDTAGGDSPGDDPAARLAALIRRDPSLLTGDGPAR
ncbi:hypothetical protein K7640_14725 [Micromonospora sp. PLK6-60]|uniref:hypothetical protein n=1 Tax=Micromonospora sp. PLK6-60 TaxID=2873383 RepID=UPI001CA62B1A|nr:hypothetical protein [Micromonospora sp. PLK6-60]MBY8873087.1 hypothetical protein [Micromonospora sp. PLK6-60]